MTRVARAGGLLRAIIVLAVGAALAGAALRFGRTAAAPASSPHRAETAHAGPEQEGIVCFGIVDLEHGTTALAPLQPGRVVEVFVDENQEVGAGTELVRLDDGAAKSRLAAADAAVDQARWQLEHARRQPRLHQIKIAQQQAMCRVMASRVAVARSVVASETKLSKSLVIPENEKILTTEKVKEMEALEQVEKERLAAVAAEDVETEIHHAELELRAVVARREEAVLALKEFRLRAPRPGKVLRVLTSPGEVLGLQPGQPAILFAAQGPQVIRATVEQEFARRVQEGAAASVRDDADPTALWRGRVTRIASWYSQRRTVLHDPSQLSDVHTLECLIVLEPGQPALRFGQSVRVSIGPVP